MSHLVTKSRSRIALQCTVVFNDPCTLVMHIWEYIHATALQRAESGLSLIFGVALKVEAPMAKSATECHHGFHHVCVWWALCMLPHRYSSRVLVVNRACVRSRIHVACQQTPSCVGYVRQAMSASQVSRLCGIGRTKPTNESDGTPGPYRQEREDEPYRAWSDAYIAGHGRSHHVKQIRQTLASDWSGCSELCLKPPLP